MEMRRHLLRAIFATSTFLTAFWVIGLVWDSATGRDGPILALLIASLLAASMVSSAAFRNGRLAVPAQIATADVVLAYIPRLVGAYLLSVPAVGLIVWLSIRAFSEDPNHPEGSMLVGLMAVWLPLWFAPALGVEWSWRSIRKHSQA
jgi:hypothetical protein